MIEPRIVSCNARWREYGTQDGKRCLLPRLTLFNKLMTKSCPPLQRVEAVILNDKLIPGTC
jgi:hypothetical protein